MTRAMKNSGVEWIGEIPQEWGTWKLKHVASIQTGNTPTKTNVDNYSEVGLLWVKPDNLKELKPIEETNEYISNEGKQLARIANAYSTLVCCIGTVGKIGYSNVPVAFNQQINAVDFNCDKILWKYGLYFLSCQKEQHQYYMNGNVVYILNSENHGRIKIAKPELSEQQAISDYLDKKCAEIDAVISSKQEQNKLLKEQRQSIIYEAVTKGLDKNAPMKDSGVEWIGEIPKAWEKLRTKYLFSVVNGATPKSGVMEYWEGDIPWITPADYTNDKMYIEEIKRYITEDGLSSCGTTLVPKESIIVSNRAPIGLVALAPFELCTNQGCKALVKKCDLSEKYYYYYFTVMNDPLNMLGRGTTFLELSSNDLNDFFVPVPRLNEQKSIAEYLDNKCAELDRLIQANITTIRELKEYRQSAIYEAVTGKKEFAIRRDI